MNVLTVWILIQLAHAGPVNGQDWQFIAAYTDKAVCERNLAAVSGPEFGKPAFLACREVLVSPK